MTQSELICSALSSKFFYDEFVFDNLEYIDDDGVTKQFADLLINMYDTIIIVQLKERNKETNTSNQSWFKNKVNKIAVSQINTSIDIAEKKKTMDFKNRIGQQITIDFTNSVLVPIVVFQCDDLSDICYSAQRKSKKTSRTIRFFEINDFKYMCEKIETPSEILEYLEYRVANATLIQEKQSIDEYLCGYTSNLSFVNRAYLDKFKFFLRNFGSRRIEDVKNNDYIQVIRHLMRLNRLEIFYFMERFSKTTEEAYNKKLTNHHRLIDKMKKLGYVFLATPEENQTFFLKVVRYFKYYYKLEEAIGINVFLKTMRTFALMYGTFLINGNMMKRYIKNR